MTGSGSRDVGIDAKGAARNAAACFSLMLMIGICSGCGTRNIYDGIRFRQEIDCSRLQGADRDDCYRRSDMSYDEYQRQLQERKQEK